MKARRTKKGSTLHCSLEEVLAIRAALERSTADWIGKVDVIDHLESGNGISEREAEFREGLRKLIQFNRQLVADLGGDLD
jgi:hypothetical protein